MALGPKLMPLPSAEAIGTLLELLESERLEKADRHSEKPAKS